MIIHPIVECDIVAILTLQMHICVILYSIYKYMCIYIYMNSSDFLESNTFFDISKLHDATMRYSLHV